MTPFGKKGEWARRFHPGKQTACESAYRRLRRGQAYSRFPQDSESCRQFALGPDDPRRGKVHVQAPDLQLQYEVTAGYRLT